jgi:hypothetical protein
LEYAAVSQYSVVKQRLKCNTGKVRNCLIQFLLTRVHEKQIQHLLLVYGDFPKAVNAVVSFPGTPVHYAVGQNVPLGSIRKTKYPFWFSASLTL